MFSRPVLPSRSWPETPQGSSVRVPSSTSAQGYMPQMFGPSQSHPPHNPSPPSNAMNDQVVQLLEALNHRIISLEQQLWASQNRRAAQKNVRNSPVRAFIDPDFGQLLSTQRIFDGCQRAGGSLSLVVSGQRPRLAPEREVLLIVRSDEEAEQVRNDVGRFKNWPRPWSKLAHLETNTIDGAKTAFPKVGRFRATLVLKLAQKVAQGQSSTEMIQSQRN